MPGRFFIIACLLVIAPCLKAQEIPVLECKYIVTVFRQNDSSVVRKTVWISSDRIFEFNTDDPSKSSLYDFRAGIRTIKTMGLKHEVNIKDLRLRSHMQAIDMTVCNAKANAELIVEENKEVIQFDSSMHIPFVSGGYRDFLDNGVGFLPVHSERKATNETDGNTVKVTITICLQSKEQKMMDAGKLSID